MELPDPDGPDVWELHLGKLVKVELPKKGPYNLQVLIRELLIKRLSRRRWLTEIHLPYSLTRNYDVRAADVGVVLRKTWEADPDADYLIGSPDLVIQIKSRSNRDRKMGEYAILHITHGAQAVWLVRPERREVIVITAAGREIYGPGQEIPLPGKATLPASNIFPI
jgi:Uma2 family endonuclease